MYADETSIREAAVIEAFGKVFAFQCQLSLQISGGGGKDKDQRFLTNAQSEICYEAIISWTKEQAEEAGTAMIKNAHAIFVTGRYMKTRLDDVKTPGRSNVGAKQTTVTDQ
jgi:hypothetical protein